MAALAAGRVASFASWEGWLTPIGAGLVAGAHVWNSRLHEQAAARTYMRLGDHDRALVWLEKLYAERGGRIRGLNSYPEWDPLRADPRFQDLLRRARLLPPLTQLSTSGLGTP